MLDVRSLTEEQRRAMDRDMEFLAELKKEGCLEEIKDERFSQLAAAGIIAVTCPDGEHTYDIFGHLCRYNRRIHLPALNGGGMLLSPFNPHFHLEGQALINSVAGGWKLGKGKTILLISHWPCGQAHADAYPLAKVLLDTLLADDYITAKLGVSEEVVLPLFHVDWTPLESVAEAKRRRTYVIKNCARKYIERHL
jgi:hypothetical protein